MEFTARLKILGFKAWKAPNKDTGEIIDSGKIYAEVALKHSSKESYGENDAGFSKGFMTQEYKCTDSSVVRKIKTVAPPFFASVNIDQEFDGTNITQIVLDIKPEPVDVKKAA